MEEQGRLQGAVAGISNLANVIGPLMMGATFSYFVSDSAPIEMVCPYLTTPFVTILFFFLRMYHKLTVSICFFPRCYFTLLATSPVVPRCFHQLLFSRCDGEVVQIIPRSVQTVCTFFLRFFF